MRNIFKAILSSLFDRKKRLGQSISKTANSEKINVERCQRILNYWLDTELFDLPECPMDNKKQIKSEPADNFVVQWGELASHKILDKKLTINETSRLLIMFQCHRAGYIAKSEEKQKKLAEAYRKPIKPKE